MNGPPLVAHAYQFFRRAADWSADALRRLAAQVDARTAGLLDQIVTLGDLVDERFDGVDARLDGHADLLADIRDRLAAPKPGVSYATEEERKFLRQAREEYRRQPDRVGAADLERLGDALHAARLFAEGRPHPAAHGPELGRPAHPGRAGRTRSPRRAERVHRPRPGGGPEGPRADAGVSLTWAESCRRVVAGYSDGVPRGHHMPTVTVPAAIAAWLATTTTNGPVELHDEAGTVLGQFVPRPAAPPAAGDDTADRLDGDESPDAGRWLHEDPPGTEGDPQPNDPASIAAWIAEFDATPAPVLTDEEYAAFKLILAEQRLAGMEAMKARVEALKRGQP